MYIYGCIVIRAYTKKEGNSNIEIIKSSNQEVIYNSIYNYTFIFKISNIFFKLRNY